MQPSKRLQRVLAVGGTLALFPVLKDWPTEELQALLKDVAEFAELSSTAIETAWRRTALEPSLFLNPANAKFLDKVRDKKMLEMVAMTSEICSVVRFYLGKRGIEVPMPEEE